MPGRAVVEVEGARMLRATMRKAGADLNDLKDAHQEVANLVAAQSRTTAPSVSGRLASSVRGNRAQTSAIVKAGGAAVPYAGVIHWGWPAHGIAAQPWLADTAAATEPIWYAKYLDAVERIVGKIKGK